MKTSFSVLIAVCLIGVLVGSSLAQEVDITITDLGTLGGPSSVATDINDFGHIVGWSDTGDGERHAFLWTEEEGMQDLGTLGGPTSVAYAVNIFGQVVGSSRTDSDETHAFLWTKEEGMQDIGTLGGNYSIAVDIDNFDRVVGWSSTEQGDEHATLWTVTDFGIHISDLGTLGGSRSRALGTSLQGYVGWSLNANGERRGFYFPRRGISMHEIGTLGGDVSFAEDINNRGYVVGSSRIDSGDMHAFIIPFRAYFVPYLIDLGTLGGPVSFANAINDLNQIVGYSTDESDQPLAFLWDPSGMKALDTPGDCSYANGINNTGQIVGSIYCSSDRQAALWELQAPEFKTRRLKSQVEWLVFTRSLNYGQGNSLIVKLNKVLADLKYEKNEEACNILNAFTNQVQSLVDEGELTSTEGQELIEQAEAVYGKVCP